MRRYFISLLLALVLTTLALSSLVTAQERKLPPALASLVEAERAFARTSVAEGPRAAFIAFFAEDGINFQPHPTKTREAFLQRPAPAQLPPVTLDWQPVYADVSGGGDLGYTTGPYTLTNRSAQPVVRHGYYFSVWQKQADDSWKVVVDCGISTPAPPPGAPAPQFQAPRKIGGDAPPEKISHTSALDSLLAADRALLQAEATQGVARALPAAMTEDARLHRDDMFPLVGKRAISSYLKGKAVIISGAPIKADVARWGDLGYTYGSYESKDGAKTEKGYYVRVWKSLGGKWRVVLDTATVLPPEQK